MSFREPPYSDPEPLNDSEVREGAERRRVCAGSYILAGPLWLPCFDASETELLCIKLLD